MRWLPLVVAVVSAACGATSTTPDLAVVAPGCREPSACYVPGTCGCTRASVLEGGGCLACDPRLAGMSRQCDCTSIPAAECLEPGQVCVGRGITCTGKGARCVDPRTIPAGGTACDAPGGEPPTLTGDPDGGTDIEPRCAFVDDTCCPGTSVTPEDMSVPDLGMPDLATID